MAGPLQSKIRGADEAVDFPFETNRKPVRAVAIAASSPRALGHWSDMKAHS